MASKAPILTRRQDRFCINCVDGTVETRIRKHFTPVWRTSQTDCWRPVAAEFSSGPMFCGYPCSSTIVECGLQSWVTAEGRQVTRHKKQGNTWYSYRDPSGVYVQVLRIPKGEKAPAVTGLGN